MQQNHLDSLNAIEGSIGSLVGSTPTDQAFVGQGSDQLIKDVEDYLRNERFLSGGGTGVLDEIKNAVTICGEDIGAAAENLNTETEGDTAITTVFLVLVLADVLQAGIDIFTDVITAALGIVLTALYFTVLVGFGWAIFEATQALLSKLNQINSQPQSQLPPHQTTQAQNSLSPEQERFAEKLHNDYQSLGLSLDDIRKIIEDNPNLTEAQLRELLTQYANVIKANPKTVNTYGALAVFEEFIALADYDAAHGGNYALKKPVQNMPNLIPGIDEATAEMGAMEEGRIPWPLTPSPIPRYDAKDPSGVEWDEKSYRSIDINGKPYDAKDTVQKLQKDFGEGEKIIFDDSQLTQQQIDDTYKELKQRGQENDVVWWPTQPT